MTTNAKIARGPNAFDMAANMFRPMECETVTFNFSNEPSPGTPASIDCARSLDAEGHEWELELFLPFSGGYRLKVQYNCHTRLGEVLEVLNDPELERLDHELERAEHAMTHPNRHR